MPSTSAVARSGGGRLPLNRYVEGVLAGDRAVLARAITLVESRLAADAEKAAQLLDAILPYTGRSRRVGITGVPGVGKSTFIDALGMHVTRDRGERLAVLSVDPSSPISGGSILGDKTRMERLSMEERAFIRPSPAGGRALQRICRHRQVYQGWQDRYRAQQLDRIQGRLAVERDLRHRAGEGLSHSDGRNAGPDP